MWKRLLLVLFFVSPCFAQEQTERVQYFDIPVPKGFVSNYHASNLADEYVSKAENVLFDKDLGVRKRFGYDKANSVSFGSASVRVWDYTTSSGTQYLLVLSSNVLRYSVDGTSFAVIISTLPTGYEFDFVSAFDRQWFNSSSFSFYIRNINTVVITSTGFPEGKYIEKYRNRLWVAGVDGNETILYGSGHLDGDNWTLGGNATDPVQFTIGSRGNGGITGLYSVANGLLIFTKFSAWVLVGSDQANFEVRNISNKIGCLDNRSIQEKQGRVYWVSSRGLERLEFNKLFAESVKEGDIQLTSDPYGDIMDKIVGLEAPTFKIEDTVQSDFSVGYTSHTSVTATPNSVVISSPSIGNSTSATSGTFIWYRFEHGVNNIGSIAYKFTPKLNTRLLKFSPYWNVDRNGGNPSFMTQMYITVLLTTGTSSPEPEAVSSGTAIRFPNGIGFPADAFPESTFNSSNYLTAGVTYWIVCRSTVNPGDVGVHNIHAYLTDDSEFINVGIGTQTVGSPNWTVQLNAGAIFKVFLSSGQFVSSVKDLGASVGSYRYFNSNFSTDNGDIDFYVRGSASQDSIHSTAWSYQINGSSIVATLNRYIQYRVDYQVDAATQIPSMQDVTLEYSAVENFNLMSWVDENRYHLSYTTNNAVGSILDEILVLDQFDNPTIFRGIGSLSYAEAFGEKYFGTSASTSGKAGFLYYFNDTFSDDGQAINAFIETKDFCGKDCYVDKYFDKLFVRTSNNNTGSGTFSTKVQFDNDGSYFSLGDVSLTEKPGLVTAKVPFPLGTGGNFGKTIRFRFENSESGQDFQFYGGRVYYNPLPME